MYNQQLVKVLNIDSKMYSVMCIVMVVSRHTNDIIIMHVYSLLIHPVLLIMHSSLLFHVLTYNIIVHVHICNIDNRKL